MKHSDKPTDMIILADRTNSVQELTKLSSAVCECLNETENPVTLFGHWKQQERTDRKLSMCSRHRKSRC